MLAYVDCGAFLGIRRRVLDQRDRYAEPLQWFLSSFQRLPAVPDHQTDCLATTQRWQSLDNPASKEMAS